MQMSQVIRQRRSELGLSQVELAALVGIDTRQIRRYESGRSHPVLPVAVEIARALKITVDELAGAADHRIDLSGRWWAAWQSFHGAAGVTTQELRVGQRGDQLSLRSVADGVNVDPLPGTPPGRRPAPRGPLHGELRLWDNEILIGWYALAGGPVRAQGSLYLVVGPGGAELTGRWVGQDADRAVVSGWSVLARDTQAATHALAALTD